MKRILAVLAVLAVLSSCELLGGKGAIEISNKTSEYDFYTITIDGGLANTTRLGTNESLIIPDLDAGERYISIKLSNFFFGLDTGGNAMEYFNNHNFNVISGMTNSYDLFPAYLTITNDSALNLGYVYINSTTSYDLMHIMGVTSPGVTNFLIVGDGYVYTNEFIAGTYDFIFVSGRTNGVRNTNRQSVTLSPFETNHVTITGY